MASDEDIMSVWNRMSLEQKARALRVIREEWNTRESAALNIEYLHPRDSDVEVLAAVTA